MLKGMCQRYFSQSTPLNVIFEKCRKAGFDAVELAINKPGSEGITPETTPSEAEAIGRLAREHGVQLHSFMFGGRTFSSRDAAEREQGNQDLIKQVEIAAILGIDTVLVVPGNVNAQMPYDEVYERSQETLAKVVPAAEQHKVHLAIENVWNNFLLSPLEFARYVDEFNSPYVGAYFDVGNILKIGFPEQWIRILGKRIRKVHVKDYRVSVGSGAGFVPLLAGDVNWTEVRTALREIGYEDVLTAELTGYPHAPDQALYDIARHIEFIISGQEG